MVSKSTEAPLSEAQMAHDADSTGKILAAQPTVTVRLPQRQAPEPPLPDEVVIVNGYRFQIQRGVTVEVPQTVAEILTQAGRI